MSPYVILGLMRLLMVMIAAFATVTGAPLAMAQAETSTCLAIAQNNSPSILHRAGFELAQSDAAEVSITYVGHSAFRIETASGVSLVTDFNGNYGEGDPPQVVTMNHAHSSHYTDYPDPAIMHVLRGWNPQGDGPADHNLRLEDVYIRNVATDLYAGGMMIEQYGNSIFIFEVAGLCIGHLGHLHHKLTPQHIAEIGRLDILFMPVDGTYTMSQAGMIELAGQLRSSMVIPMHFFSTFSLQRFLAGMEGDFAIVVPGARQIRVSLGALPERPTVTVLSPF
jgi:L-ascorbate metabolism protein UlaG (beta-lactamase superfamily)